MRRLNERLAHAPELLDEPTHEPAELAHSLRQVAQVNRWLGGRRAVLHALRDLLHGGSPHAILDVGTGSADIPLAIERWARSRDLDVHITATDLHPQMRAIAAANTAHATRIDIAAADALELPYADDSFDIVLLSLTLHHFEPAAQIRVLREASRVARRAIVVNELERCWPNYVGALLLSWSLWRSNRLTRHDGPLSVLRSFRTHELRRLATGAGLRIESLRRAFFYRIVLIADTSAHHHA
jgi:SAM-dependent methyltransferase